MHRSALSSIFWKFQARAAGHLFCREKIQFSIEMLCTRPSVSHTINSKQIKSPLKWKICRCVEGDDSQGMMGKDGMAAIPYKWEVSGADLVLRMQRCLPCHFPSVYAKMVLNPLSFDHVASYGRGNVGCEFGGGLGMC
jgi:hypothetical protein